MNILISIEGIDGSGKSTLAKNLQDALIKKNKKVILTKEPGGSNLGKYLRTFLQNQKLKLSDKAELFLFLADRAQHFYEKIIPALNNNNTIIISDRLSDSSLAYQGYARGLDKDFIEYANNWIIGQYQPKVTIYLKIDHQTALSRIRKRNQNLTTFEKENFEFFSKVINGFDVIFKDKLKKFNSNLSKNQILIIDGTKSQEEILKEVLEKIKL